MSQSAVQMADASPPTVSESRTLEVSTLHDEGLLEPDGSGVLRWRLNGDPVGAMRWERADQDGRDGHRAVVLSYATKSSPNSDPVVHEETVSIATTPCNFGGERPWFLCPGPGCNERVGKLHCPPGGEHFRCRHCHDLAYESSRASGNPQKSARLRYERIHRKLDPDAESHHPSRNGTIIVTKPKGMHWDTYWDLHDELAEACDDWLVAIEENRIRQAAHFERLAERRGNDDIAEERREWQTESKRRIREGDLMAPADEIALGIIERNARMAVGGHESP